MTLFSAFFSDLAHLRHFFLMDLQKLYGFIYTQLIMVINYSKLR